MTTALTKYDAAWRALAEAKAVDEVKDIRDLAVAMATYARQAKNHDLEADAIELRMRATRRLGEIVAEQRRTVGLNKGTIRRGVLNTPRDERPTLESQGIDKNLAKDARTFSVLPKARFEERIAEARDVALGGVVDKAVKRRRRKAIECDFDKPHGKPTDHANAPHELREVGKTARHQRKREALQADRQLLATLPRNLEGWRRRYLEAVARYCVDIPAEMNSVVDGLQRIADRPDAKRLKMRARAGR